MNMWSDIFLHDAENGDRLAIVLMDTQGLFDHKTTNKNGTRIFSLTTLMSSMQIFNIFDQIQHDHLEYLKVYILKCRFNRLYFI